MLSRRLIVLLMLIMAILPVTASYAHYSDSTRQFLNIQAIAASDLADDGSMAAIQHDDHCQPSKSHPTACSFHVCVDCALTSSFVFIATQGAVFYSSLVKPETFSIIPPPDIKPPISIL